MMPRYVAAADLLLPIEEIQRFEAGIKANGGCY